MQARQFVIDRLRECSNAAVSTGAGVSTLCGIPDFRRPRGLHANPDAGRIFDIGWFPRDPSVYYKGCRELVYGHREVEPGPVHHAVAKLEKAGIVRGVITQNKALGGGLRARRVLRTDGRAGLVAHGPARGVHPRAGRPPRSRPRHRQRPAHPLGFACPLSHAGSGRVRGRRPLGGAEPASRGAQ